MAGLTIERPDRLEEPARARFAAIYEPSFPPSERDPTADLLAGIDAGRRHLDLACEDGEILGLAVTKPLTLPGTAVLEYLAVDPDRRNHGIGAVLLDGLAARLAAAAGPQARGYILEVELPDAPTGPGADLPRRRIGFYQRNGASLIECAPAYRAPDATGSGTVPYLLMWLPVAPSPAPAVSATSSSTTAPTGELLHDLVNAILTESYELDPDDPLVAAVLADLVC
jgi:GNAT superfamily N-acetyltransferase